MRLLYRFALLAVPTLCGCEKPSLPASMAGVAPVGRAASVVYVACPYALFVVWSDLPCDPLPADASFDTTWQSKSAAFRSADGRAVRLTVWTTDGERLRVAVNGAEYRPEGGTCFVRTRGGAAQVTQLPGTRPGLPDTPESRDRLIAGGTWERLAEEDAEVRAFVAQAAVKE